MEQPLFSASWLQVAQLKLGLKSHVDLHRHQYRGELWYVLQDHITGKNQRFSPEAYFLLCQMNGQRTAQQIWEDALLRLGEEAPTQEAFIRFLSQLHSADVLKTDRMPDIADLEQRRVRQIWAKRKQMARSPLAIRVPLVDPDRFLTRWLGTARHFMGWTAAVIWLIAIGFAGLLAAQHWPELSHNVADRVFTPGNLFLLWFVYPVVKALHELGHGFAVKRWGGEVHEMGIMFLVFFPVPYVDASSSAAFRQRYQRVLVSAAGMLVELFLAALALFVWISVEPGVVSALAYNVMLIGGISTLIFNGNPLLRFDGYYILADLVEVPNLASRSNRYLGYLIQRYLFGMRSAASPVTAAGERGWFVFYSVASFLYRTFVITAIILLVASQFFFLGVVLAAWAGFNFFVWPLLKHLGFIMSYSKLGSQRPRAIATSAVMVALLVLAVVALPAPYWTRSEGVVWLPEESVVRIGSQGWISEVVTESGALVEAGDVLLRANDPELYAELAKKEFRQSELQAQLQGAAFDNLSRTEILREQLAVVTEELAAMHRKIDRLTLRSPTAGTFILPEQQDLPGAYVNKGSVLGYVLSDDRTTVRTTVPQTKVALVRGGDTNVLVRVENYAGAVYNGVIQREIPEGTTSLPSPALGFSGGGDIAVDPTNQSGNDGFEKFFVFDIQLAANVDARLFGNRVHVRFDHGYAPLGWQFYRYVRQLLLKQFDV